MRHNIFTVTGDISTTAGAALDYDACPIIGSDATWALTRITRTYDVFLATCTGNSSRLKGGLSIQIVLVLVLYMSLHSASKEVRSYIIQ